MKRQKKTLQELTIKDCFMFAAVMADPENAKGLLERTLDVAIDYVEVCYEKSIIYNPEYKGIRLDVYIKDDKGTHFDVEMQVANEDILRRSRYYHSQIDMDLLSLGTNDSEVPEALVHFLKYVGAELEECNKNFFDEYVERLQKSVTKIKFDRELGVRYMLFEELMKDEYKAGKEDGKMDALRESILDFLADIAPVSDGLRDRILSIEDSDTLTMLLKRAARVTSLEEFEKIEF